MQNFLSVKNFFICSSQKQTSVFLEKTLLKGKRLYEAREQDSCGWDSLSSLPLFSVSWFYCHQNQQWNTFKKKSAQKMRRANFSQWLSHLYLALPLGASPLQGRSSVAPEGLSFLFLSTWSKVLSPTLPASQLQLGHRVDAKRTRKCLVKQEVMFSLESEDNRHCQGQ